MVTLQCSDGHELYVTADVAEQSAVLRQLLMDCQDRVIQVPLNYIQYDIACLVVEFCRLQLLGQCHQWDIPADKSTLFQVITAADHLNIKSLLNITCQRAARLLVNKGAREIEEFFWGTSKTSG